MWEQKQRYEGRGQDKQAAQKVSWNSPASTVPNTAMPCSSCQTAPSALLCVPATAQFGAQADCWVDGFCTQHAIDVCHVFMACVHGTPTPLEGSNAKCAVNKNAKTAMLMGWQWCGEGAHEPIHTGSNTELSSCIAEAQQARRG